MSDSPEFCYSDFADKRARWLSETRPAIMQAARQAVHTIPERQKLVRWMHRQGIATAEELHDMVRAAPYVASARRNCDPIQPVSVTIERGGDCDQWAAVLLAGLAVLGFRELWLMATGDELDPHMHVCVVFHAEGREWISDPKPDQQGAPFNQRADSYPKTSFYRFEV